MSQTTLRDSRRGFYAGQIVTELMPAIIRAGSVAANKKVTPGQPVIITGQGPAAELVVRDLENGDTLTAANFGGFVRLDTLRTNETGEGYEGGRSVSLVEMGVIGVKVTDDVNFRDPVYVGVATATLGQIQGAPGSGFAKVPGARFYQAASANELAKVQVFLVEDPVEDPEDQE